MLSVCCQKLYKMYAKITFVSHTTKTFRVKLPVMLAYAVISVTARNPYTGSEKLKIPTDILSGKQLARLQ